MRGLGRRDVQWTAVALVAAAAVGGSAVHADGTNRALACGDTVTGSVKLAGDLSCTGDGLVVGASNITIDLAGHRLAGDDGAGDYGIDNTGGYDTVRVTNGTIADFDNAVRLDNGASSNRIDGIAVVHVQNAGFELLNAQGAKIMKNSLRNLGGPAIAVELTSSGALLQKNRIVHVGFGGIELQGSNNVAEDNVVSGTPNVGIHAGGTANTVSGNTLIRTGDGVMVTGDGSVVKNNDVEHAAVKGILVDGADDAKVIGNRIAGGAQSGLFVDTIDPAENLLLQNNVAIANDGDGLHFGDGSGIVKGNRADGNVNGIVVCDPDVTFASNSASYNRDYGLTTTAGFVDGGGNSSVLNGLEPAWVTTGC